MPKFSVIIPAAGKGERFGGKDSKVFAKLDGRPLFLRTLERFVTRKDVCQTILVVAPSDIEMVKTKFGPNLGFMNVQLVEGGEQRRDSVLAGLRAGAEDADFIAVHDAARPCIRDEWIDAVFAEATKSGAAILACPIEDTLKRISEDNVVEETVGRSGLYRAQTPQVFARDVLVAAYENSDGAKDDATDDSQLVEQCGHAVTVVISDATNLKVTTRGDLKLAASIIKSRPVKTVPRMGAFEEAQW